MYIKHLIIIILAALIIYYHSQIEKFISDLLEPNIRNTKNVISDVDGNEYKVQTKYNDEEIKKSANVIAEINNILLSFISELKKKYPNDLRIKRLIKNYRPENIYENDPKNISKSTSYSISKGERFVFCLRSRKNEEIHKKNTLLFVALHELAHMASKSYGHNNEFLNNFTFLLSEAENMGYYKRQNFNLKPQEYCGMTIKTSPI